MGFLRIWSQVTVCSLPRVLIFLKAEADPQSLLKDLRIGSIFWRKINPKP